MRALALILLPLLAACALPGADPAPAPEPAPLVTESPGLEVLRPLARPSAPAPVAPIAPAGSLGQTLAGLGAPGEAGLWLRTGLVTAPRPGRITTATGASLAVELRPSGAAATAGSQLSLAAMRALALPLTQLAPVTVYAD